MTILPKKKQPKDKAESNENNSEHPHSPAGGAVEGRTGSSSRHGAGSPGQPRWGSPPPAHDPLGASGGVGLDDVAKAGSSGAPLHGPVVAIKRRLRDRSSPHRNTRKQRHDGAASQRASTTGYGRQGMLRGPSGPTVSSETVRPCQVGSMTLMGGGAAAGSELEVSNSGYNSDDESQARRQGTDNDNELLERWFETRLKEKRGYVIKKMGEDGACLFRCVADQVFGDQEMHSVVRHNCVDYMAKNGDFFKQYVTEDFNMYLSRKRMDHCHGNHIEMQALCELYNRPIEVYQARWSDQCYKPINTFHGAYKTDNEPIRLSYHQNIHYNSVIDPYKATVGVGLGLPGFQPGLADKNLIRDAVRLSEDCQIEQTMLEDKLRETDWEVTQETIEEQVARESYLQWLKDQEKRENSLPSSSAATRSSCASCSTATESSSVAAAANGGASWWDSSEVLRSTRSPRSGPSSSTSDSLLMNQASPMRVIDSDASTSFSSCSLPLSTGIAQSNIHGHSNDPVPSLTQLCPSTSSSGLTELQSEDGGATGGFCETIANAISPEMYCLSEDEDAILARVMAQSQQEYYNSLKRSAADLQQQQLDDEQQLHDDDLNDKSKYKDSSKGKSRMPRGDPKF